MMSARVLVTAWPQDMRTRCIHHVHIYLVDFSWYLGAINHLFVGSSYHVALRVILAVVAKCSLHFVQYVPVSRGLCYHSAAPVVAAATATAHNRVIAATTAVAGTGCFSCGYPYFIFVRATRLLILLILLLVSLLKPV